MRYGDWRSLELAIKEAAKKAARQAGPGISAASIDAQIRQARFDRFLCRVFAEGEQSEWLLKGGMSMLAPGAAFAHHQRRGPRSLARVRSR
jgi:endonuclease YncB( thermonuclease family)